ncbi:NmrA/HSCARG family protein [Pontibacter sp. SGAir0037]|uniref:NmrA/HSCARG family protein n=1 Tax=Pontibacter sp. SGAir0037 TaxID=2571030 RepID=UPI0010CD1EA5|nr:NmrA/HSCARG family protein [Pontibacter sp. SGAir0037]QCR22537.1 hypothetical protein C1N53_09440 [Pontibacter sp. SGAir0037]
MKKQRIVVCGATGNQGSAVVKSLLQNTDFKVTALTRKPQSQAARQLHSLGAEIEEADLLNEQSLLHAFTGADGVFGITQPWSSDYKKCDTAKEIRQGKNIASASKMAGVQHLVFSSVLNLTNTATGVSHADSKLEMEQYIKTQSLPYTIVRCSQFMENIGSDFFPVKKGVVKGFVDADAKVPYVSCQDIGKFIALAFAQPEKYLSRTINLVGDFISGTELAQLLGQLRTGEQFTYKSAPKLLLRLFAPEFYTMRVLFEKNGRAPYPQEVTQALHAAKENLPDTISIQAHLQAAGFATKVLS